MICTFDTEGTTVTDARGTYGVMYYWDLCTLLGEPEDVYPETVTTLVCHDTGRDCTTLYNHLHTLLQYWEDCGDTVKVAVHNLTYDFGYIRHFISCSIKRGKDTALVLYDSLALFRTSLRNLGDALGYRKLELDYYRAYAPDTVLGESELAYNTRDTELLMLVLCRNFLSLPYVGIERAGKSVLTKTGMVKAFDRENAYIGATSMGKRTVYDADRYETYAHQFSSEVEMERWNSYSNAHHRRQRLLRRWGQSSQRQHNRVRGPRRRGIRPHKRIPRHHACHAHPIKAYHMLSRGHGTPAQAHHPRPH